MDNELWQALSQAAEIEEKRISTEGYLRDAQKFAMKYLDWSLYRCQIEWAKLVMEHKNDKIFINVPVDHGKSALLSYVIPLMDICRDRNTQILFGTASPDLKKSTTMRIRDQLRYNRKLIGDFGKFYDRENVWESHRFTVIRDDKNLRDPTFTACTVGQSIEGIRAKKGILDDFIDFRASTSEAARREAERWLDQVFLNRLIPLAPVHVIGTRWHPQDTYQYIIEKGTFILKKYMAIDRDWNKESILCPERWSIESLIERRKNIGERVFDQKFRNNPSAMTGARFNSEWLTYYKDYPELKKVVMAIDPAIGEKTTNDYFARAVVGLGIDNNLYLMEMFRDRMDFPAQVKDIQGAYDKWRPSIILIEDVAYQRSLIQQLRSERMLPIKAVPHTSNKLARLEEMGIFFENGTIKIKEDMFDFIHEYTNFPGAHDDQLDALEMCVSFMGHKHNRSIVGFAPGPSRHEMKGIDHILKMREQRAKEGKDKPRRRIMAF